MRARTAVAAVTATAAVVALAGCTVALLPHERRGTAPTTRALAMAWRTPATQPDWLPEDATGIRYAARTTGGADAAPAAILATTAAALPKDCAAATTATPAAIEASWAPSSPSAVQRCGNWYVAKVQGGYYGWTPAR